MTKHFRQIYSAAPALISRVPYRTQICCWNRRLAQLQPGFSNCIQTWLPGNDTSFVQCLILNTFFFAFSSASTRTDDCFPLLLHDTAGHGLATLYACMYCLILHRIDVSLTRIFLRVQSIKNLQTNKINKFKQKRSNKGTAVVSKCNT